MVAHSFDRLYAYHFLPSVLVRPRASGLEVVGKPINAALNSFPASMSFRLWSGQFVP